MDLHNIPGDTGKPWRQERLIEFATKYPASFDPVALGFLKEVSATEEDRAWWAFLYSTCYSIPTACALFSMLPLSKVQQIDLDEFWGENKRKLLFQSDRRYVGSMDKFVPMAIDLLSRSEYSPWGYLKDFVHEDPEKTYSELYKEVSSWYYYGRFGTVLFIDTFRKCLGLPTKITQYDWKRGSTTTSGLFNAFYRDEVAIAFDSGKLNLSAEDERWLDKRTNQVLGVLKKRYPDSHWDVVSITRIFCTYRKLYKGTRYLGYYVDRQQEELHTMGRNFPELGETWELLWKLRAGGIDNKYLGEVSGFSGIRKDLCKVFLREGKIV